MSLTSCHQLIWIIASSTQHKRRWSVLLRIRLQCALLTMCGKSLTGFTGKQRVMYALTKIKGVGRRYSNLVCKKADVDLSKRYAIQTYQPIRAHLLTAYSSAGELTSEELE